MRAPSTAHFHNGNCSPRADFLALSPIVERHARVVFRVLDAEAREEAVAEAVAAAFQAHVSLKARDRNPAEFPSTFATIAVLHVKNDQHVRLTICTAPQLSSEETYEEEETVPSQRPSIRSPHSRVE